MSKWTYCALGEIADVQTGPFGSQLHQKDYKSVGTPIITVEHLGDNRITYQNLPLVGDADKERLSKYLILEGDIVFSRVGSVDRRAYVSEKEDGWLFSGRLLRVRVNRDEVSPKFLSYYFGQESFKEHVRRIAVGATMPSINTNILSNVEISYPSRLEQDAITIILSSLDDKIDLLHRQNQTLEALAQTLFRHWFIDNAQGDWKVVTVGDVAQINRASINNHYNYSQIQYLDTGSITEGIIAGFQQFQLHEAPSRARRLVEHNDVIISTVRPNQKHYGIIKNPVPNLVVSTGFCVLTCDKIDPHFLYIFLTLPEMTEYLHVVAEGSTSAYPSLRPSDIAGMEFQLPSGNQLDYFSTLSRDFWLRIDQNNLQIHTLEKLRDMLLPKLMSGEVRVLFSAPEQT